MALSKTPVHQTEQVMQELSHTSFPFPPRYRKEFWGTVLLPSFSTLFLSGSLTCKLLHVWARREMHQAASSLCSQRGFWIESRPSLYQHA